MDDLVLLVRRVLGERCRVPLRTVAGGRLRPRRGQDDGETGTLIVPVALGQQLPAVELHEMLGDGESDAKAVDRVLLGR